LLFGAELAERSAQRGLFFLVLQPPFRQFRAVRLGIGE
jgi:hypothetical protein